MPRMTVAWHGSGSTLWEISAIQDMSSSLEGHGHSPGAAAAAKLGILPHSTSLDKGLQ